MPTALMPTALLVVVGGGALSALLYLSVLTGSVGALIFWYLAPLPLLIVGLGAGSAAGLMAGAAGTVLVTLATLGVVEPLGFLVTSALPAAVVIHKSLMARPMPDGSIEWYPPGLLVMALTGLGILAFLTATLLAAGAPGGLQGVVQSALESGFGEVLDAASGESIDEPAAVAAALAPVFPAIAVTSWLLMAVVNGALAQGVLMRFGVNRRPAMRVADLELPGWAPLALAASGVVSMAVGGMIGFVALNVALILALPFFFGGLAVVHAFAQSHRARVPILVTAYVLIFLFVWPVVMVVGLGAIEQWIGLRRRFAAAGASQEKE